MAAFRAHHPLLFYLQSIVGQQGGATPTIPRRVKLQIRATVKCGAHVILVTPQLRQVGVACFLAATNETAAQHN